MLETFAITGYGRSGTKFLATQLNKSTVWKVEHEPSPYFTMVENRFIDAYYGEVNSYLLYTLLTLPVKYKAVVLRDPYAILQSAYNRGHALAIQIDIQIATALLLSYIKLGVPYFKFSKLVRSKAEIIRLARTVGIKDLEEDQISLEPANMSITQDRLNFNTVLYPHVRNEYDYFNRVFGIAREN